MTSEFTQFGTNFININPGKVTTQGMSIGVFGSVRPLSLDDAEALRRIPQVLLTNAGVVGNAEVSVQGRARRVTVFGSGPDFPAAFKMELALGQWLPHEELNQARAFTVLGPKVRQELFGAANPLGSRIEIGGYRYRVIGVIKSKGNVLGWDFDDCVYIPSARALELFNREGLMEIHVVHDPQADVEQLVQRVREVLIARHGREDFTITPQQKMLDTLNSVLQVLTFAVGALGGISLVVGGVGILTIMTIAVAERTVEIGLLRALGAPRKQILTLFLAEATLLASAGGLSGLALGYALAQLLHALFPVLPVSTPWMYALLAELIAVSVGLGGGCCARRPRLTPGSGRGAARGVKKKRSIGTQSGSRHARGPVLLMADRGPCADFTSVRSECSRRYRAWRARRVE